MNARDLAILCPLWKRIGRVATMLESAEATVPEATVVLIVSADDRAVQAYCLALPKVMVLTADWPGGSPGDYARKVQLGFEATSAPLLFLGADDIVFHESWFERCVRLLQPGIGVVGTNDGTERSRVNEHSTHSLVTREYVQRYGTIDERGKVLHEGYWHEWTDDELLGTAKFRGAYAFAADALVEHRHSDWGLAPVDELYAASPERMMVSRPLYEQRRALWGR